MYKDNECKNCTGVINFCCMPLKLDNLECPCLGCLLKSICGESCPTYQMYLDTAQRRVEDSMRLTRTVDGSFHIHRVYLVRIVDLCEGSNVKRFEGADDG